jgi:hypothetical protein
MAMIAQPFTPVQVDAALRLARTTAGSRYAGEAARMDRGLVLALNGAVTRHADGTASVRSAADAEVVYTVNGHCDCPDASRAPEGRCKHRWAVALVKWALARLQADGPAPRYYATYTDPAGVAHPGVATATPAGWLFVGDQGEEPLYAAIQALALGGNCAIADAKRAEEEAAGGLAALVCGYGRE